MPYFQLKRYFLSHHTAAEYNGSYEAGSVIITTNIIAITLIIISPNTNPRLLWLRLDDEEGILVAGGVDADNRALKYNLILAASQSEDLPAPKKLCFASCVFRRSVEFFSIPKQEWVTLADMTIARCKLWTNNQAKEIESATNIFLCRQDGARPCCHQRDPHGLCPDSFVLINDHRQRSSRSRTSQIPCQSVPPCLTAPKGCNRCWQKASKL